MRGRHFFRAALFACLAAPGGVTGQSLGQIDASYESHADLMLVSGELAGFAESCGFGRKPDRAEMLNWYRRHALARSEARIDAVFDLGMSLGRDTPCTVEENIRLVRRWETHMRRTEAYVHDYRLGGSVGSSVSR